MEATFLLRVTAAALFFGGSVASAASQGKEEVVESIRQRLHSRFPDMKIIDIQPTRVGSLYEVFTGRTIVYVDQAADYLIYGNVVDLSAADLELALQRNSAPVQSNELCRAPPENGAVSSCAQ